MNPFLCAPVPLRSVLIANRGEIACRIIRTCKRLGLRAVAVHSDADRDALHVRLADEAVRIGPAPAAESYLDMDAILDAARGSGADAIHPGYGFLSENAVFAAKVRDAGLAFVGPSPEAIAAMGSKIEAKKIAEAAGVATVPGYHGGDQSDTALMAAAERIGYPLMIKASAGGGGRGMRLVDRPDAFQPALVAARAEARAAFGDDAMLLERAIASPRHLEVQLVGDRFGNLVHLFERDCSVQRNNQKVLEEAPAPNLDAEVRARLHEAALGLGRAIGYHSAGTVEFIMEAGQSQPYFLEMNTRLQVEHPVTEEITGIDLVEWQLAVAAGLPLPLTQDRITLRGHAIEARIAAERADLGFQPSVGRFAAVEVPSGLRFDSGIAAGSEIGLHYDSMIAKAIASGPDRQAALARLAGGLERLALAGPVTNQAFLLDCLGAPDFAEGRATTRFLAQRFPEGWRPDPAKLESLRAAAAIAWLGATAAGTGPWTRRDGFRVMGARRPARLDLVVADDYGTSPVRLIAGAGGAEAEIGGRRVVPPGRCVAVPGAGTVLIAAQGLSISAHVIPAIDVGTEDAGRNGPKGSLASPLPGLVTDIAVAVGDEVAEGDRLVQIEAMKLVHTLSAPHGGRVTAVRCKVGETVAAGATLVDIETSGEE